MSKHAFWVALATAAAFLSGFAPLGRAEVNFSAVRADLFAGFAGNPEALGRGIAGAESILAVDPKNAEARVWHGAGMLAQARQYFKSGDMQSAGAMLARGQKEMDDAVALQPDNLAIRLPRGAALMTAGRNLAERDPQRGNAMMAKALLDYEFAYERQKDDLPAMGQHPAGELLIGIADANSRLGKTERAAEFFEKIAAVLPDSPYAKRAALWKETKSLSVGQAGCIGCHTGTVK